MFGIKQLTKCGVFIVFSHLIFVREIKKLGGFCAIISCSDSWILFLSLCFSRFHMRKTRKSDRKKHGNLEHRNPDFQIRFK